MLVREETSYKTKPNDDQRKAHLSFLREQGGRGKLLMSGRFSDGEGALIVWKVESVAEAQNLASQDPYAKWGLVSFTLREWVPVFDYTRSPPLTPT